MNRLVAGAVAVMPALALAGCLQFHPAPPPGAPAGAKFITVHGVAVRYIDVGHGPALLLLHGFGASLDSWRPFLPALSRNHRVIAIDLKGFGYTGRPPGDYSPEAEARLARGVLDQLGVRDVSVVAHSWGCSVAMAFVLANQARVRRVALLDAYVYRDEEPSLFRWAKLHGFGEILFSLFYAQRAEDKVPLAFYDPSYATQAMVDAVARSMRRPGAVAAALAVVRDEGLSKLERLYRRIKVPVLLIWGRNDIITPLWFGQRLAAELADARLVTLPRCGHIPMIEAPRPALRALVPFLAAEEQR